jgi:hypothetical protein
LAAQLTSFGIVILIDANVIEMVALQSTYNKKLYCICNFNNSLRNKTALPD